MIGRFAAFAVVLPAGSADAQELRASERVPAIMMTVTPKGVAAALSSSALFDAADHELRARSDLGLRSIEQVGVDLELLRQCPNEHRFGCWLAAIGRASKSESARAPAVLLVVSLQTSPAGGHVLHSSLFDLKQAFITYQQISDQGGEDWRDRAEDALYAEAAHAAPVTLDELDPERLREYFAARFDRDFRALVENTQAMGKLGRVHVRNTPAGALLSLDGRPVGATREGGTDVADVPVGAHVVEISRAEGPWTSESFVVRATLVTHLEYEPPPPGSSAWRDVVFWGGTTLAAVGTAFVLVSAVQSGANLRTACLVDGATAARDCSDPGFPTLGFSPSAAPSTDFSAVNPAAPPTGLLGFALFGAGATMSTGVLLFGEDDESPWLQLGAGVVVGALTYAIGSALDPRHLASTAGAE